VAGSAEVGQEPDEEAHHRLVPNEYALYVELLRRTGGAVEAVAVCRHPDGTLEAAHGPFPADAAALLARFRTDDADGTSDTGEHSGREPLTAALADDAWVRLTERLLPARLRAVLAAVSEAKPVQLLVLPSDELWNVPYAALPLDEVHQLVDKAVVTLTPSLRVVAAHRAQQGRVSGESGRPVVGLFSAQSPMSGVERERLRAVTPVRDVASYRELAEVLAEGDTDLLYCTAHAEAGHRPGQDILIEAGALNDWSVLELAVPATVLLGCCGSGRVWHQQGSEPSGLALAFMLAGARDVVGPVRKVHGSTCAALLPDLAQRVLAGQPPAAALRDLQRQARDDAAPPRLREEWHLFHCIGTALTNLSGEGDHIFQQCS
jgi:hypothetical protein